MGIKVTHSGLNPKKLKQVFHQRIKAAGSEAGRAISAGLRDEALKRIPKNEKWMRLYRDALTFLESKDGSSWAIAGVSPTKLTTVPAESTQIKITGSDDISMIVRPYIWTVDTLPAIVGGYKGGAIIRPASKSEMSKHRESMRRRLPEIRKRISEAGGQLIDGFPVVQGKQLIDMRFLQLRLEHGLGGFPRVPHFTPASRQAKNKGRDWVNKHKAEIQQILKGGDGSKAEVMDEALRKLLNRWRHDAWNP